MPFLELLPVYEPGFTPPQLRTFMLAVCTLADQD
jgi:hypothetical protein